jgi:DNA-binding PadR family transcriptional regulator
MRNENFGEEFRFFRGGRRAKRGDIRPLILMLLKDKPMHGYEIISALEERSHGFWRPSAGTIYPNLQLLEEQELVTSNDENGKKTYSLTDKGKEEAEQSNKKRHSFSTHGRFKDRETFMLLRPVFTETMQLLRELGIEGDSTKADAAIKIIKDANEKLSVLTMHDVNKEK